MAPAGDDAAGRSSSGAPGSSASGAFGSSGTTAASPLNAAADVGATLSKDVHQVEWNGQVSENSFHLFVNETAEALELFWGDDVHDTVHSSVEPHANSFVGTYNFHTWRVRSKSRGLIATYTGPSVILTVTDGGHTTQLNPTGQRPPAAPPSSAAGGGGGGGGAASVSQVSEPGYRQRSSVLGMPIWAFDCVSDAAVSRLAHVVSYMLAHSPPALLQRLVAGGASFAVFGTEQVVSDVPAHRFMRYNTGRNLDTSARGLGATPTVPVTSCGEENLTMQGDRWYPCQSILIHEVGHMVHNLGLQPGPQGVEGVLEAYRAASKARLYPRSCYMMTNEQEYWAVAVESWFESTVRDDVNAGIRTRSALRRHDPRLAALLAAAFGDGDWRFWKDCPRPLAMPTRGSAAAAAAAQPSSSRPAVAAAAAGAASGAGAAVAAAVTAPPASQPSWRSRHPVKRALVDSMMDSAETSPAGGPHEAAGELLAELHRSAAICIRSMRTVRFTGPAPHVCGACGPSPSSASSSAATRGLCGCWTPVPLPTPLPPSSPMIHGSWGRMESGSGGGALLAAALGWLLGPCVGCAGGGVGVTAAVGRESCWPGLGAGSGLGSVGGAAGGSRARGGAAKARARAPGGLVPP